MKLLLRGLSDASKLQTIGEGWSKHHEKKTKITGTRGEEGTPEG